MAGSDDATHQNENDDDASSVDRSDDAITEIETMMSEMNTGALDDTNRRNCAQNVVSFLIGLLESEVCLTFTEIIRFCFRQSSSMSIVKNKLIK